MDPGQAAPCVKVTHVLERDIDFLLLGEFVGDPEFARWFVERACFCDARGSTVVSVARSVSAANGESDLEIWFKHPQDGKRYALLIENKVTAEMQPGQAQRYLERGRTYKDQGCCQAFRTVLVAPCRYLKNPGDADSWGFQALVCYETILEWFRDHSHREARSAFRCKMMEVAIGEAGAPPPSVPDETVTRFWQRYHEIAQREAPELQLPMPTGVPAGSTFIYFHPDALPSRVRLVHKVQHGHVDLQFRGVASKMGKVRERMARAPAEARFEVHPAGASLAICRRVPVLLASAGDEADPAKIKEGVRAAKDLLRWFEERRRDLAELGLLGQSR